MSIIGGEWGSFLNRVAGDSLAYNGDADIEYIGDSGDVYYDNVSKISILRDHVLGVKLEIFDNLPYDLFSGMNSKYQDFEFIGKTIVITNIGVRPVSRLLNKESSFKVIVSIK